MPASFAKPQRWDVPFGIMSDADVDRVLNTPPFSQIDPNAFPAATPLREIVRNDCRLTHYEPGDIIVREGDYGSSLFFIVSGCVRVVLDALPPAVLGRRTTLRRGFVRSIAQLWTNHRTPEYRDLAGTARAASAQRGTGNDLRVFIQDIPAVLGDRRATVLESGVFFGELAALARIPRTATVIADDSATLLEMRWQGARDIRRRAPAIHAHIDRLYRERSLLDHLQATPLFSHLSEDDLAEVAAHVTFETVGEFDWYGSYQALGQRDAAARLQHEPAIATEGDYPNGLIMIRTGFARLSHRYGASERTISYLGRGSVYGFDELAAAHRQGEAVPLRHGLRGLGYVDLVRVPTRVVETYVLDRAPEQRAASVAPGSAPARGDSMDSGLLEFLVERRFVNGTAAMVIDLERCTGCDDCVRACANAHDGNPRFVRHGPQSDRFLVANACMHCVDPVCMIGCPTGAIHRDAAGGEVVINDETCIGCATCASTCPYHNIRMVDTRDERGELIRDADTMMPIRKATKCDLCVDQPGGPACQRACPHDALVRLNLSDPGPAARTLQR